MSSLLLDPSTWDLTVDIDGNIAVASDPYAKAQDVACACRLFQGDLYFDTTQGVPFWQILGRLPPIQFIKNAYTTAALTVPGIVDAVCFITSIANRAMRGQVQVTDKAGGIHIIGLPSGSGRAGSAGRGSVTISNLTSNTGATLTDAQGDILVNQ